MLREYNGTNPLQEWAWEQDHIRGEGHSITPTDWQSRRVVVTGYYDGPTEGIIDFGDDIGVYCFKTVAFDFDREKRVLKLARVASEQLRINSNELVLCPRSTEVALLGADMEL